MVTCSQAARTKLHNLGLGHLLKSCVRVLGVDFTDSAHGPSPTTDARFERALAMGRRLLNRGIPLDVRRDLWRTRVVTKASWGHLMQPPSDAMLKNLEGLFKQVVFSHKMGSTALRQLLEGHAMHVGFASGMHCLRAWRNCGMTRELAQDRSVGTWFGNACRCFSERAWLAARGWRCLSFPASQDRLLGRHGWSSGTCGAYSVETNASCTLLRSRAARCKSPYSMAVS